ncbi:hypothetical protein BGZ94_005465 [Podila epigama]|nr:hypothetical protein BGZ94_005465 [Podila epigama]
MATGHKGKSGTLDKAASEAAGVSPAYYKELQDTFRLYDSEGNGFLTTKKLQLAMRTVGFEASIADIQEIVQSIPTLSIHQKKTKTSRGAAAKGKGRSSTQHGKKNHASPSAVVSSAKEGTRKSQRGATRESRVGTKSKYVDDSSDAGSEDEDGEDEDTYKDKGAPHSDSDDSGFSPETMQFTFHDFVSIMTPGNEQYAQDEVQRVFQLFDGQAKGYIRLEDLKRISNELGLGMTDPQLEEMLDEADRDGTGAVTFDEFLQIMSKTGLC